MSKPRFEIINGSRALSWFEEGSVRYMTADGRIITLSGDSDDSALPTDNYRIFANNAGDVAIVYPIMENETGYFAARLYIDGQPGNQLKLAETGAYARFFDGVWENNGEFSLLFNNSYMSIIGEDDEAELIETNNLCSLRTALPANIALRSVYHRNEDVRLGRPLLMDLDVENIGGVTVHSVTVKANESIIGTYPIPGGLKTGETATVYIALNIPADMREGTEFTISVEPSGLIDADTSDNSSVIALGYSDFMMSLKKDYNEDDIVTVVAGIVNTSDFSANAELLLRAGSTEGDIIDAVDFGEITGRDTAYAVFSFDPKILVPAGEGYEEFHFELISDKEHLADKSDFVVLLAIEPMPEDDGGDEDDDDDDVGGGDDDDVGGDDDDDGGVVGRGSSGGGCNAMTVPVIILLAALLAYKKRER